MVPKIKNIILAAITTDSKNVGGGVPIFYAQDKKEMETMAASMANIIDGAVHELANGALIIVKH